MISKRLSLNSRSLGLAFAGALAGLAVLTACGGGGGGIVPKSGGSGSGNTGQTAPAGHIGFTFVVPNAQNAVKAFRRRPMYISSGTASLTVVVNPGTGGAVTTTATLPAGLSGTNTAGNATCTTGASGATCTVYISAPGGSDVFEATFYDSNGNALSTGTTAATAISATGTNTVNLTFNGVPATIAVSFVGATPLPMSTSATPTTIPISVSIEDADGNTILSPGAYAYPITLVSSNSTHLSLSTTTISAPPSPGASPYALTATYDGANADQFTKGVPYITASVSPGSGISPSGTATTLPEPSIVPATIVPLTYVSPVGQVTPPSGFTGASNVRGVAYDPHDNGIYVAAYGNSLIQVYDATSGSLVAVIGSHSTGEPITDGSYSGTSGSTVTLCQSGDIVYDPNDGNLYVADAGYSAIREIEPTSESAGSVVTLAGPPVGVASPNPGWSDCGSSANEGYVDGTGSAVYTNGSLTSGPQFHSPYGITFDPNNNMLYVSETGNNAIRQVTTALSTSGCYTGVSQQAGCVETVAGNTTTLHSPGNGYTPVAGIADGSGVGGASSAAQFNSPYGVTYNTCDNDLYVSDSSNNEIRQVNLGNGSSPAGATGGADSSNGVSVVTFAGGPTAGYAAGAPNGYGTNSTAEFSKPLNITMDQISCDLFVTDFNNDLIREITTQDSYGGIATAGTTTIYAGIKGTDTTTNGQAGTATFAGPFPIVWVPSTTDPFGATLYEVDNGSSQLRKLL